MIMFGQRSSYRIHQFSIEYMWKKINSKIVHWRGNSCTDWRFSSLFLSNVWRALITRWPFGDKVCHRMWHWNDWANVAVFSSNDFIKYSNVGCGKTLEIVYKKCFGNKKVLMVFSKPVVRISKKLFLVAFVDADVYLLSHSIIELLKNICFICFKKHWLKFFIRRSISIGAKSIRSA